MGGPVRDGSDRIAIGRLAKHTGTHIETIRYYERLGLWPAPPRSAGGYRLYAMPHLKRLSFIRRARALGFSIDEVRTLLQLADERKRPCAEVRVVAETHLADVRVRLADLKAMERALKETVARCAKGTRARCPLIDALYRGEDSSRHMSARRLSPRRAVRGATSGRRTRSTVLWSSPGAT
ncbi:MAG: MerR family transcriptional regulator [Candidatus Rokuibacteriota bacterium]